VAQSSSKGQYGDVRRLVLAALLVACSSSSPTGIRPKPAVGTSTEAQRAFADARAAFLDLDRGRTDVRLRFERFLDKFPDDGLAVLARVYLANVLVDESDLPGAVKRIAGLVDAETGRANSPGEPGDLAELAMGRIWRREGKSEPAYLLLRTLVGKLLDPWARAILDGEVTMAALEAKYEYEAFAYMDTWLREVPEEQRDAVRKKLRSLLEGLPRSSVENVFRSMSAPNAGYGVETKRLVAERLAKVAIDDNDANLARWLLDLDAQGRLLPSEATLALQDVASAKRGQLAVAGQSIGLVLPTSKPSMRDAAADVARGAAYGLGLPHTDPTTSDSIELLTKSDAGASRVALEELAGEGAAIIIAGVDTAGADEAMAFANRRQVAVITLAAPSVPPGQYGFVLGTGEPEQLDAIDAELRARKIMRSGLILEGTATGAALSHSLFIPPRACDYKTADLAGVRTWTVMAPESCALRVLGDLARTPGTTVMLSLRAVADRVPQGLTVLGLGAGKFPARPDDAELATYAQRFGGKPTWSTVLGRDAAVLAREAVRGIPTDDTSNAQEVARRRDAVRAKLEKAQADLWSTSDARGFSPDHTTKRTLKVAVIR
jgi:hypothetical protein